MGVTIGRLGGNRYIVCDFHFYDIELLVAAVDLAKEVKNNFNVIIPLNHSVIEQANYYRGKRIYGNSYSVLGFYIKNTWLDKYEFCKNESVTDGVMTSLYERYIKEEIIDIAKAMADYCNTHNILETSFNKLITKFDMGILCNAHEVALSIVKHYKPFVDIKEGVLIFNDKVKSNRDAIFYINYCRGKADKANMLKELAQYGIL